MPTKTHNSVGVEYWSPILNPEWGSDVFDVHVSTIRKSLRDCCIFLTIVAEHTADLRRRLANKPANLRWRLAKEHPPNKCRCSRTGSKRSSLIETCFFCVQETSIFWNFRL
ncbi:MAG: hypothetical protein ACRCUY_06910 [Thermoguttaceae bacterium]